jgi:hypothetical protein
MWPRLLFADWRVPLLAAKSHFFVLGTRISEILDVSTSKVCLIYSRFWPIIRCRDLITAGLDISCDWKCKKILRIRIHRVHANDLLLLTKTYETEISSQSPKLSSDEVVHISYNICEVLGTSEWKIQLGSVELCICSNGHWWIRYNYELQIVNQYLNITLSSS